MDGLFLLVPTTNPKPLVPVSTGFGLCFMEIKWQVAVKSFSMFLICLNDYSAAYDCSMAKKRRAAEQALGVPVNKRKSLLMKPRHYSPNLDCREECDDRTEAEEEDSLLEASDRTATGSKWE